MWPTEGGGLTAVETSAGPDGVLRHSIDRPAASLPPVTKRDMEQAWEAAQTGSNEGVPARSFRFAKADGGPVEILLNDSDAAAWAEAVDRTMGRSTAHGISVCLRLLALVDLMSRSAALRRWFSLERGKGADLHPALLQAAALAPLNDAGGFDETAISILLPPA